MILDVSVEYDQRNNVQGSIEGLFSKIAERISEGKYGLLLFMGGDLNDIAYVFFGHKTYEWVKFDIRFPAWWNEKRREILEWDKLFKL